jgi:hypothetical protein
MLELPRDTNFRPAPPNCGTIAAQNAAQQASAAVGKLEKIAPQPLDDYHFLHPSAIRKPLLHKDLTEGKGFEPSTGQAGT